MCNSCHGAWEEVSPEGVLLNIMRRRLPQGHAGWGQQCAGWCQWVPSWMEWGSHLTFLVRMEYLWQLENALTRDRLWVSSVYSFLLYPPKNHTGPISLFISRAWRTADWRPKVSFFCIPSCPFVLLLPTFLSGTDNASLTVRLHLVFLPTLCKAILPLLTQELLMKVHGPFTQMRGIRRDSFAIVPTFFVHVFLGKMVLLPFALLHDLHFNENGLHPLAFLYDLHTQWSVSVFFLGFNKTHRTPSRVTFTSNTPFYCHFHSVSKPTNWCVFPSSLTRTYVIEL